MLSRSRLWVYSLFAATRYSENAFHFSHAIFFLAPCSPGNGTCNIGNGPCNSNHNCTGTLVCGYNEGACDTAAGLHGPEDSCCTDHYRCDGIEDGCCTVSTPCGKGDGDCDFDEDCLGNLKCGNDNCEQETGSFDLGDDCCEWWIQKDSKFTTSFVLVKR